MRAPPHHSLGGERLDLKGIRFETSESEAKETTKTRHARYSTSMFKLEGGPVGDLRAVDAEEAVRKHENADLEKTHKGHPQSMLGALSGWGVADLANLSHEELLKKYEATVKKASIMRYLMQTEYGIHEEPLDKAGALFSQGTYESIKRQKVLYIPSVTCGVQVVLRLGL